MLFYCIFILQYCFLVWVVGTLIAHAYIDCIYLDNFFYIIVGARGFMSGILIGKKKTVYLTPSAIARLIGLIIALATLTLSELVSNYHKAET